MQRWKYLLAALAASWLVAQTAISAEQAAQDVENSTLYEVLDPEPALPKPRCQPRLGHYLLGTRTALSIANFLAVSQYMKDMDPETSSQKDLIANIVFHFVDGISVASKGNWIGATGHTAFCLAIAAAALAHANFGFIVRERIYYFFSAIVLVASFAASVANVEVIKIIQDLEEKIPIWEKDKIQFTNQLYSLTSLIVTTQVVLVLLDFPFAPVIMRDLFGYRWHPADEKRSILYKIPFGELVLSR